MRNRIAAVLVVTLALPSGLFADFHYTETTKITGGSMVSMVKFVGNFSKQARQIGEPTTSSVYVRGNRMARIHQDNSEIVDLDQEMVTHIDHIKKQYYTVTFQQMKEQLIRAEEEAAKHQQDKPAPKTEAPPPSTTDLKFDVAVRNTGAQKEYSGLTTHESILTLTMLATDQKSGQTGNIAMSNDVWLTPEIPGYKELRDFEVRYAQKLGEVFGSAMAPITASMQSQMKPGSMQGFGEMAKEVSKMKGVPIYTVMRMGSTTDGKPLPAASEAPLPPDQQNDMPSKGDMAKQGAENGAASAIASKLGGFGGMIGGFGHKKKDPPPDNPPADNSSQQPPPTSVVLMETTTEMGDFSSAPIDGSHFQVPAGYQQIQNPELRHQ